MGERKNINLMYMDEHTLQHSKRVIHKRSGAERKTANTVAAAFER